MFVEDTAPMGDEPSNRSIFWMSCNSPVHVIVALVKNSSNIVDIRLMWSVDNSNSARVSAVEDLLQLLS
jgi:hypothetical protein